MEVCPGWAEKFLESASPTGSTIKMNILSALLESVFFASLMFNEIMKESH